MVFRKVSLLIDYLITQYKISCMRIKMIKWKRKSKKDLKDVRRIFSDPDFKLSDESAEELKRRVIRMKLFLVSRKDEKPEEDKFLRIYNESLDNAMKEYIELADDFFKRREVNESS